MRFPIPYRTILGGTALSLLAACGQKADSPADPSSPTTANNPESNEAQDPPGDPWFEECAQSSGLEFVHVSGHSEAFIFPEIMTTGAALFDMDNDGDLDAYLVQGGHWSRARIQTNPGNALYENQGDGTFVDVTEGSGADDPGYGMGVTTGDYDGDGDVDLYVSNLHANALLRNDGGGKFTDVTKDAGVGGNVWSASAAFVDFDGDGDLDLFVTNYIYWNEDSELPCQDPPRGLTYCSPKSYNAPTPDYLYRNRGDGTFEDVTQSLGLRESFGNGLGVVCADFDDNGTPELFVANDGTPNKLWTLGQDVRFVDKGLIKGCAVDDQGHAKAGMGVSAADLDFDGDEDLLVVNLKGEDDSMYRNDRGRFSDRTPRAGLAHVSRQRTRFGVVLRDFNHDGWIDLYEANGHVTHPIESPGADPFADHNHLLQGTGPMRFEERAPLGGVNDDLIGTSRALAWGDIDGDGDLDLLVHNKDLGAHLLRNVAPKAGNWVQFDVLTRAGAPALGARLTARAGDRILRREVRSAESYCSAGDPRLHFGLGERDKITEVIVRWSDGTQESFGQVTANRTHALQRGQGSPVSTDE